MCTYCRNSCTVVPENLRETISPHPPAPHPWTLRQARSLQDNVASSAPTDPSSNALGTGAAPARLAFPSSPPSISAESKDKRFSEAQPTAAPAPHDLLRRTVKDGEVSNGEWQRVDGAGGDNRKVGRGSRGWVPRRRGGGTGGEAGDEHVWTLVPGVTATFEVAATAPEEMVDETVKMEVSS